MLLKFINNAIQKYLDTDPEISASLKAFDGQYLLLSLTDIKQKFLIKIAQSTLVVSSYSDEEENNINTTISTDAISLLRLAFGADYQSMLNNELLKVDGDIEFATQVREVFMNIDIDWEEVASKYVGDAFAYQLGNFSRRIKDYKQRSVENFKLDVGEYLQEESRLMPTKIEIDKFLKDVDQLQADLDRLEARTQRLLQTINQ